MILTGSSLNINNAVNAADLVRDPDQFLSSADLKGNQHGGKSLFACPCIDRKNINIFLGQGTADICQQAISVIGINLDLCQIFSCFLIRRILPLGIDQSLSFDLRQIQDIDTVCSVDGNASSSGNETDDLISGYR